ncbi:MAG: hypothetical protein JNM58_09360 [Xanthomonadaceae bacterium]|nr:hypothetical protein [Xanthomonadaceae bacterium]
MKRLPALVLVAGFGMAAQATGPQWTALIAYDDGGAAPQMFAIAVDSEAECLAAVSAYRDAEVVEPCHPEASAITDPNDANRTSRTPMPVPREAGRKLGDVGHVGGG